MSDVIMTKKRLDELTYEVIGAAIEVHRILGPGLLESVYHCCMKHELDIRGIKYLSEIPIPVLYKGVRVKTDLRCDLLIENCVGTEMKSRETIAPNDTAQLLTYMKLLKIPKGVLINFNCLNIFKNGQKTLVNEMYAMLPDE